MSQEIARKICLVGECLSQGGAEKAMANLSRYFSEAGYEVHTVIVLDKLGYEYSGRLLNLGLLKNNSNGIFNKFRRFRALKKYLDKKQFDFIIDFRIRVSFLQELLISRFLYRSPTIYTVHSAMTHLHIPDSGSKARLIYSGAYGVVAVSGGIAQSLRNKQKLENVFTIPNPIAVSRIQVESQAQKTSDFRYVLAVGSMNSEVKQFDKLIQTYHRSSLPGQGIKLVILGDGLLRDSLGQLCQSLQISDKVVLPGFEQNPYPWFKNALFSVLCSKNEGLPMVIIESLASGTPVVAFDCFSGPGELINHEQNGLLLANQDFDALQNAMERMSADAPLYAHCKSNSISSVQKFDVSRVGSQWEIFFKTRQQT